VVIGDGVDIVAISEEVSRSRMMNMGVYVIVGVPINVHDIFNDNESDGGTFIDHDEMETLLNGLTGIVTKKGIGVYVNPANPFGGSADVKFGVITYTLPGVNVPGIETDVNVVALICCVPVHN